MKKLSFLAVTILSLVWQGQARSDSFGQSSVDAGVRPFYEQAADPSVSSNLGMLYSKDASGITQLFYKTDDGTVYQITPLGAGTGDVVGPASATDNCFPRFNTTTGKLIQNSGVCADDSNNVTGAASVTATTFTGALTGNADTATALASNPSDCSANQFATTIAASGNLTCAGLADADVPDDITLASTKAISTTLTNGAGTSANPLDITSTLGIFDGSDDYTAIDINLTNADHTGATNTVQGIDISGITADAQATETAINIGNGWDTGINAGNSNIVTTGKIGIGTASPSSALHITSNSVSSNIVEVAPATAAASDVYFKAVGTGTAVTGAAFILAGDTNTSTISTIKNTQRGAGDPVSQYTIFGGADWTVGIDNSDSDKFKISASTGLGTSDVLSFTTAGVADFATALADSEISDTLTSSLFVGSGSSTTAIDLATAEVAGITPVANGGTGLASGTSGGVPAYTASGTITSSAALTANGVVVGGGTGAVPTSTAAGTDRQYLRVNSSGVPVFEEFIDPTVEATMYDEFLAGANTGQNGWSVGTSGTGAGVTIGVSTANHPGLFSLNTGTDTTGSATKRLGTTTILLGGGAIFHEWMIQLATLSTVGEEYIVRLGFGDSTSATDFVDGAYFEYDRLTSGDFWILKTASNSSRTSKVLDGTSGNPTVAVTNSFVRLGIQVNAAATQVDFFIDGSNVGNITTNIPTGAGRETSISSHIVKSAGTTSRSMIQDYALFRQRFTTPR